MVVEFCTFSCVNWLRTLPYVRAWDERYRDDGLVVIGAHAPEFEFEHDVEKIRAALEEMGVRYPIAVDNDYAVWRAFDNNYWPALYFADAEGRLRHHHFGEEDYQRSERAIRQLLTEAGATGMDDGLVSVDAGGVYGARGLGDPGLAGDLRRLRPGGGVCIPRRPGDRPESRLRRASRARPQPVVALGRLDRWRTGDGAERARGADPAPLPRPRREPGDGRPGGRRFRAVSSADRWRAAGQRERTRCRRGGERHGRRGAPLPAGPPGRATRIGPSRSRSSIRAFRRTCSPSGSRPMSTVS